MFFPLFFLALPWTCPVYPLFHPLFLSFLLSISPGKSHACPTPPRFSHRASCVVLRSVSADADDNGGVRVLSLVLVVSCACSWSRNRFVFRGKLNVRQEEGIGVQGRGGKSGTYRLIPPLESPAPRRAANR